MAAEREAREPGWYWVRKATRPDDWRLAYWPDGGGWCFLSTAPVVLRPDSELAEIGPRIHPPGTEPAGPQPQEPTMTHVRLHDADTAALPTLADLGMCGMGLVEPRDVASGLTSSSDGQRLIAALCEAFIDSKKSHVKASNQAMDNGASANRERQRATTAEAALAAERARADRLAEALRDVRRAIVEDPTEALTDTLWLVGPCPETAIDRIDAALAHPGDASAAAADDVVRAAERAVVSAACVFTEDPGALRLLWKAVEDYIIAVHRPDLAARSRGARPMAAEREAREPGWYWVRKADIWAPGYWGGEKWSLWSSVTPMADDYFAKIGPRIHPPGTEPAAPAQPQPERTVRVPGDDPSIAKYLTCDTHRIVWDWAQAFHDAKVDLDGECAEVHVNFDACNRFAMRFEPDGGIYLMLFGKRKHLTEWLPPSPATITGEVSE